MPLLARIESVMSTVLPCKFVSVNAPSVRLGCKPDPGRLLSRLVWVRYRLLRFVSLLPLTRRSRYGCLGPFDTVPEPLVWCLVLGRALSLSFVLL